MGGGGLLGGGGGRHSISKYLLHHILIGDCNSLHVSKF